MTFENSKRLYHHFIAVGNKEAANELLLKYPQLEEKKSEVVTEKKQKK